MSARPSVFLPAENREGCGDEQPDFYTATARKNHKESLLRNPERNPVLQSTSSAGGMEEGDGNVLGPGGTKSDEETQEIGDLGGDEEDAQRWFLRSEPFEIKTYVSMYPGRTQIMRLLFIADRYSGDALETLQLEALRMAYDEIKKGEDVWLLIRVVKKIRGRLGPNYEMDSVWSYRADRKAKANMERLENMLDIYKEEYLTYLSLQNRNFAQNVRLIFDALGDFNYARGEPFDAVASYLDAVDYCISTASHADMLIKVIIVCIEREQFRSVMDYAKKGEELRDLNPIARGKLSCALGLAYLETERFKCAADKFLEISPALGSHFLEVASPHDIAIYGALCALATFERTELKEKLVDNVSFQFFLDQVIEVRELIIDFYSCRYSSCFEYLESLRERLLFDIHLYDHFEGLFDRIRHKALLLYIRPYVSVDLKIMAKAFRTDDNTLEDKIRALINTSQIQGRIDIKKKVLYAQCTDQRKETYQRVLHSCIIIEHVVKAMLLRAIFTHR